MRIVTFFLSAAALALAQSPSETMAFTVSMDQPNTHYYHVEFHCTGLRGETQDFKLPVWMPGYYRVMDYSKDHRLQGCGWLWPAPQVGENHKEHLAREHGKCS